MQQTERDSRNVAYPQVGGTSIKEDLEVLTRSTDLNGTVVLSLSGSEYKQR
jgi:hypothetical protein